MKKLIEDCNNSDETTKLLKVAALPDTPRVIPVLIMTSTHFILLLVVVVLQLGEPSFLVDCPERAVVASGVFLHI